MSRQPACSVVIPTYNRARLLGHTLSSLTRQTLPREEFEVIVADDGSTDETAAVVEGFRDVLNVRFHTQRDEGFRAAAARNMGIRNADAEVCVFLDSGMLAHPRLLRAHLAEQNTDRGPVAVVGYNYGLQQDAAGTWALEQELDLEDPAGTIARLAERPQWWDIREPFWTKYGDEFHHLPAPWVVFWSANISARTDSLHRIGLFDEEFRSWGAEDMDLGYRLHRGGVPIVLSRLAGAVHLPHEKSGETNELSAERNYRYMAEKYGTPIIRLLTLFPRINPFTMNDWIRDLALPSCADYLEQAGRTTAGHSPYSTILG
ncbi:glycosyltransferase [Actinospica durhamensis]|uniref:Glycosyltransferase n=1 Tax=Actinospica durhamensis TaxID=1508375 RepID=A0A941ERJ8_9ACTN|nr:glycosyltransferase [Actinospica durhamensis]MBR7837125.1 glycosyltransferase [Actinospica durhamensis]